MRTVGALRASLPKLLDTLAYNGCCCPPNPLYLSRPVGVSSPRACARSLASDCWLLARDTLLVIDKYFIERAYSLLVNLSGSWYLLTTTCYSTYLNTPAMQTAIYIYHAALTSRIVINGFVFTRYAINITHQTLLSCRAARKGQGGVVRTAACGEALQRWHQVLAIAAYLQQHCSRQGRRCPRPHALCICSTPCAEHICRRCLKPVTSAFDHGVT
eukprot:6186501-Pleurochrysis_carterae.AAC.3